MKMDIMVADADGKNARADHEFRLRHLRSHFHAGWQEDSVRINKHECDSRKFELFLMNVDGTGLEQVTDFGGFTSFPEFSPDGKTLVFCTDKDAKERYEFNIFTAEWK